MLVVTIQIVALMVSPQVRTEEWIIANSIVVVLLFVAYRLSRQGLVEAGALVAIVLCNAVILVPAHLWGDSSSYDTFFYLSSVPLIATMIFPLRMTVAISLTTYFLLLVSAFFFPYVTFQQIVIGPLLFNVFMSALLIAVVYFLRADADRQRKDLITSEYRYRLISEAISDYAYLIRLEANGKFKLEWLTEDSYRRITGFEVEDLHRLLETNTWLDEYPDAVQPVVADSMQRAIKGEANSQDMYFVNSAGEKHWLHIHRQPVFDSDGKVTHILGVAQDVTAHREAEMHLRASEERYRTLSELMSDYAFYIRVDGENRTLEWMTDSFERLTGYHPDEIFPDKTEKLFHPDDIPKLLQDIDKVMQGKETISEVRINTKRGESRSLIYRRRPVWDEDKGKVRGYYTVVEDITERKLAEERERVLRMEEEQLQMIRQFMLAISHDFRTLLATIETSSYLIGRGLEPDARAKAQPKLERIHESVSHINMQLGNLELISSTSNLHVTPTNINALLEEVCTKHELAAREAKITLSCEPRVSLPDLAIDQGKIMMALDHLVSNALANTSAHGEVRLAADVVGQEMVIEVQDSGSGITPEALPFIFNAFYRSDAARQVDRGGLGLGLTLVKMIVERHQGEIVVQSNVGKGSCFQIRLPLQVAGLAV
jgi:PAS domain S-box-containing protein